MCIRDSSLFRQHPAYRIRHPRVDALCRNGNPFTVHPGVPDAVGRVLAEDVYKRQVKRPGTGCICRPCGCAATTAP